MRASALPLLTAPSQSVLTQHQPICRTHASSIATPFLGYPPNSVRIDSSSTPSVVLGATACAQTVPVTSSAFVTLEVLFCAGPTRTRAGATVSETFVF